MTSEELMRLIADIEVRNVDSTMEAAGKEASKAKFTLALNGVESLLPEERKALVSYLIIRRAARDEMVGKEKLVEKHKATLTARYARKRTKR